MNKTSFGKGLQDGIPIGLGYLRYPLLWIMAIQSGLTSWQAVLISLTIYLGRTVCRYWNHCSRGSLWEMALTQLVST